MKEVWTSELLECDDCCYAYRSVHIKELYKLECPNCGNISKHNKIYDTKVQENLINNMKTKVMNKEFATYEQSIAFKELGFDEPCITHYTINGKFSNDYSAPRKYNSEFELSSYISAPLKQQVFRWFRDKYNLVSWVYISHNEFFYTIVENGRYVKGVGSHANYDGAEEGCINKLIEIVKNK
jgi:hypothetical protein